MSPFISQGHIVPAVLSAIIMAAISCGCSDRTDKATGQDKVDRAIPPTIEFATTYRYYPKGTAEITAIIQYTDTTSTGNNAIYTLAAPDGKVLASKLRTIASDITTDDNSYVKHVTLDLKGKLDTGGEYFIRHCAGNDTLCAVFEVVDVDWVDETIVKLHEHLGKWGNDTVMENIYAMGHSQGSDSIYIYLRANTPYLASQARHYLPSYSALTFKGQEYTPYITDHIVSDTLRISIRCSQQIYPHGTKSIYVTMSNDSQSSLNFEDEYMILHHTTLGWVRLYGESTWNDMSYSLPPGDMYAHKFEASLYPLINDYPAGDYAVAKLVSLENGKKFLIAAPFRIE